MKMATSVFTNLAKYLRNSNISSVEDLKILNVTSTSEVMFHFFGNTDDGDRIRESLNRLVQRRRLGEISLESTHFTFQQKPALKLQSLRINQLNERGVRLGDQFILSCIAQGSYNIDFVWFKDGMLVNMSKATREIWYKHLPNDGSDQHTSLLAIDKATLLDAGQYTCQVIDWGMQQCKSIHIEVREEPDVKVIPMSATIEKGSSIQLRCMTPNMRSLGIGFGWSKNRALLKLEPGSEVWEDLYPAGSLLKITNAQKSAIYTCNVAQRSMAVRVEVVNRSLMPVCLRENSWGLQWPDTGPGGDALLECPRNFVGRRVTRLCSMKDATTPEWQIPDFSACLYEPLIFPYNNFRSLTLGYQNTTGAATILAYWNVLRSRTFPLYPGEGDRILSLLSDVEQYLNVSKELYDLVHSAEAFMRIINYIIENDNSILSQKKIIQLQQLTRGNMIYWAERLDSPSMHLGLSSMVANILPLQSDNDVGATYAAKFPGVDFTYPSWYGDEVVIRVQRNDLDLNVNNTLRGITVVYKNMSHLLPHVYVTELNDGTDRVYHINSRMITVDVVLTQKQTKMLRSNVLIDLQLHHIKNESGIWNVSCGMADYAGSWNLESCISNTLPGGSSTNCICPHTGTFAVFLSARAVRVVLAKKQQSTFVMVLGCGSCLLQCLVSLLILGSYWWNNRSWLNFLKLQCCSALIGAMAIFIYAVYNALPESSYSLVATCLEAFLLVGMSAPISQALIIYAELTHVRPSQHLQPTVIAVITGVPVLAVLATELAQKSTGWRHESWWLIAGSGFFNIFITCATMLLLIFILLYMGTIHKTPALVDENTVKKETMEIRMRLLHRAAIIICGIVAMEASSILYINSSSTVFHYVFATMCSLLGFIIIVAYVVTSEIMLISPIFRKLKWNTDLDDEHSSEPIKVCSKVDGETENDAGPPQLMGEQYLEVRGVAAGSIDMREYVTESAPSYSNSTGPTAKRFLPEIRIDYSEDINLENYSTSPRKYQEAVTFDPTYAGRSSLYSVESYSGSDRRAFREFNKYADAQELQTQVVSQSVSSECTAKVLCSADVESRMSMGAMPDVTLAVKSDIELSKMEVKKSDNGNAIPDIANTTERKQPDGEENAIGTEMTACDSNANGMLDRISHDLDYLLNRTHAKEET